MSPFVRPVSSPVSPSERPRVELEFLLDATPRPYPSALTRHPSPRHVQSFFQRVMHYVINEVLVDSLANSKTFQRFAVRSNVRGFSLPCPL